MMEVRKKENLALKVDLIKKIKNEAFSSETNFLFFFYVVVAVNIFEMFHTRHFPFRFNLKHTVTYFDMKSNDRIVSSFF